MLATKRFGTLLLVLAMALCLVVQVQATEDTVKTIDIFSLNAFHGRLEEDRGTVGAALLGAYVKQNFEPENDILVDAGNYLQGTAVSTATYGEPVVEFYNMLQMDATVVGNHELDWGTEKLAETMEKANFPLLSANIVNKDGSAIDWAKPYVIVEKNGVNIGIIGLINQAHAKAISADYMKDIEFKDAAETANALIPEVREAGADVVVLVGTIGGVTDADGVSSGALIDFAEAVEGADAIVGSLHALVSMKVKDVPVVQAFRYGEKFGHITLSYDTEKKEVVDSAVEIIDVLDNPQALEADAEIATMVAKYADELNATYSVKIGSVDQDLVRGVDSPISNWVTDSMRESAGTQIAFTNPGGIRADVAAGDLNINAIYEVMPFPNTIVTGEMTGAEIKAFFEQVATVGIIPMSGVVFQYDLSKEEGSRVVSIALADGTALEDEQVYTVATNNFFAGGTDGYTELANYEWTDTAVMIRDAMIENVKANGTISTELDGRLVNVAE